MIGWILFIALWALPIAYLFYSVWTAPIEDESYDPD